MLIILFFCGVIYGSSFDYGDLEKTIITRVFMSDDEPSVEIPAKIKEIRSSNENEGAFVYCKNLLQEIIFENGSAMLKISPYCFSSCTNLNTVDMSKCEQLTEISDYSFFSCSSLTSIKFPPNLQTIGQYCFANCYLLPNFILPNSTNSYDHSAFRYCKSITEFYITPNVAKFSGSPWDKCSRLEKIGYIGESKLEKFSDWAFCWIPIKELFVPKSIKYVGNSIVEGCTQLKNIILESTEYYSYDNGFFMDSEKTKLFFVIPTFSGAVNIPSTITSIGTSCMSYLYNITEVSMPNLVSNLGSSIFINCNKLKKVTISSSIKSIPSKTFEGCTVLTSIQIFEGATSIYEDAFKGCSSLRTVYLPSTLTDIKAGAFKGTPYDIKFIFSENSTMFIEDFHMYTLNYEKIVTFFGEQTNISIPLKTKYINGMTYSGSPIKTIEFQSDSTLISIGDSCFDGCTQLQNIKLPSSIETLGVKCFYGCISLKSINLSRKLRTLSNNIFEGAKIDSIFLPKEIQTISENAFRSATITKIEFEAESEEGCKKIDQNAFAEIKNLEEIVIPYTVSSFGIGCFSKSSITSIEFEKKSRIKNLSISCFEGCEQMIKIKFPEECQKILDKAFFGCLALRQISLPPSVEEIGVKSFGNCSNLSSFVINDDSQLESILSLAFENCRSLESFTATDYSGFEAEGGLLYGEKRTKIVAFLNANPMKTLEIEEGVRIINRFVFKGSKNLERVTIPKGIEKIGMEAFEGCINLKELIVKIESASNLDIETNAFKGCYSLDCGSVMVVDEVGKLMQDNGLLESALDPCPTEKFTNIYFKTISGALFSVSLENE